MDKKNKLLKLEAPAENMEIKVNPVVETVNQKCISKLSGESVCLPNITTCLADLVLDKIAIKTVLQQRMSWQMPTLDRQRL